LFVILSEAKNLVVAQVRDPSATPQDDRSVMSEDVTKLGFKCGVEIHQQLLTEKKLFCRCPAFKYSKHHDAEVLRHMRPTLSEMGGYDGCALMEFKTKKEIVYLLNKETVCTYEMDDTPPFPINQEALDIVIEIALMLGCSIVDEMHIARKQYLDGSIPTGFQRTGIVGINGKLPFKGREIGIRQISIEEESCREVTDEQHYIRFRTDRLGIPLIEVVTEPDMTTPEEAAEVVRRIGRLMRATGKVKTGIGAVRQDVNVSIEGSPRVEIKGVPRYQHIPALTRTEALRHKALLEIKDELARRKITKSSLRTFDEDLTAFMRGTEDPVLKKAIDAGHHIRGIKLGGCKDILTQNTQPGKTFASEIAGRVRVIACLDQIPNLYHTDAYPEYTGSHIDYKKVHHHLQMKEGDVGVIVWGPMGDTVTATNEIRLRIEDAIEGVPNETRQHKHGGLSDFERILPGADRMYPDTDHPPVAITPDRVKKIADHLPPKPWEIEDELVSMGMTREGAQKFALTPRRDLVLQLVANGIDINLAEHVLMNLGTHLRRQGVPIEKISNARCLELFEEYKKGTFHREAFKAILVELAKNPSETLGDVLDGLNLKPVHDDDITAYAHGLLADGLKQSKVLARTASHFRGRVPGKHVVQVLSELTLQ